MKITIIFFLMNTFSGMGYSVLAPLFPSLATKLGLTESLIGSIISIYALSNILITPFTPYLFKKFSRIKLLYFATFYEATCSILYGFTGSIKSSHLLIILMFTFRVMHGICGGIIGTLVYSLTISLSNKKETKKALGYLQMGWCLGTTCGPVFASVFYKIGGYPLPFIVLGLFLYISVYLAIQVGHEKTESDQNVEENPEIMKYLKYCNINIIIGGLILGMLAQTFYFPCLTNHLGKNFHLSVSVSSLFFVIQAAAYFIAVQYLDKNTKYFGLYGTAFLGIALSTLGVLMIYPFPPFPKSLAIITLGCILIGGGDIQIFIPGRIILSKEIQKFEPNIDILTVNDLSSAINNLAFGIGDWLGPIIGGFLSTHVGFKYCCLILSLIICSYGLLFFLYFYNNITFCGNVMGDDDFENNKNLCIDEEKELMNHPGEFKNYDIASPLLTLKSSAEKPKINIEPNNKTKNTFKNKYIKLSDDDNENDNK